MAPSPRRGSGQAAQAELALLPSLKNCFVNLPASLVAVLTNANTITQNVVIELTYRQPVRPSDATAPPTSVQRSIFVGWTGFQSKRKLAGVVGRDGISGSRGSAVNREQDVSVVEIDATFARFLGLSDGQKVGVNLHVDPPQAHTVNIEPLTPADWEMIELHAQFLEVNFLHQIRAVPNPAYSPGQDAPKQAPHPLTLHLSPTSTANITVATLTPAPPSTTPFVKISPDAEVIVAPKTRQKTERSSGRGSRSETGMSRKSVRSTTSTVRRRSGREESGRGAVFLRGVDRNIEGDWFDDDEDMSNDGLKAWVDRDLLASKALRGTLFVSVAIVKPAGLQETQDPQKQAQEELEKSASKVIARIGCWEDAPNSQHAALSSTLCAVLGAPGIVGGLVRIEAAPSQATKSSSPIKGLRVFPFALDGFQSSSGFRFGGESKQDRDIASQRIKAIFGKTASRDALLEGPLTDGMLLPAKGESELSWPGGILRFDPLPKDEKESSKSPPRWILGSDRKVDLQSQPEIAKPPSAMQSWTPGQPLPEKPPHMVGIDPLISQLTSHLSRSSSVLLTGGLGAGKTNLTYLLAHHLRSELLFHTTYFPCRSLVTEETRVSTIKETLNRVFASAAWGARLGGHALVILDDLDRLCPVETELQGPENGRSRHISESLCAIVKQYCTLDSRVVLLASSQGKEAVNNVIIGGHVVREIVSLKAPNKESRRRVLEMLVHQDQSQPESATSNEATNDLSRPTSSSSRPSTSGQLSLASQTHSEGQKSGFAVDPTIDFLDLAGQTDGYMPGDLVLLVSRARSEALIASLSNSSDTNSAIPLTKDDFTRALKGFTPASLRNVTLQSSTVKWSSIGGLHSTRQILLETLQYPTTYAPIFSKCPLRLRSGLLLYGYPGCGKTLLASAVAGECGLNFISVKGPEILNKYIGASEKSVRDLFERAEAARPCVLFFDEFDSIAPKRGHDSTGVTDRVVNQLLTQMDGAEGLSGVYVLAATSRPDLVDPALLRPGRLDKSLECGMPDLRERVDILRAVTSKLRVEERLGRHDDAAERLGNNLWEVARRTEGYSGADLQAVVYNAQLEAIHDVLGDHDLDTSATGGPTTNGNGKKKQAKINGYSSGPQQRGTPDFIHFRYGDTESETANGGLSSTQLTERAKIAQQISNLQNLKRRQKELSSLSQRSASNPQRPGSADSNDPFASANNSGHANGETEHKDPQITWKHIVKSLETTRPSISERERGRLRGIYREFVVGRSGDMPSGQASGEVGGRTSLM